jgi:hypothetical protein
MPTRYVCFSYPHPGLFGGSFTRNPRERWSVIRSGTWVGDQQVNNLDSAASVFAARIALRDHGPKARVWGPAANGLLNDGTGKIYRCQIGNRFRRRASVRRFRKGCVAETKSRTSLGPALFRAGPKLFRIPTSRRLHHSLLVGRDAF